MNEQVILDASTSTTLIRDVASNRDSSRWEEFARRYRPMIERMVEASAAKFQRLPESDRDDIVQEAYASIQRAIANGFSYDHSRGGFRHYLSSAVARLVGRFAKKNSAEEYIRAMPAASEDNGQRNPIDRIPSHESADSLVCDESDAELMFETWAIALDGVLARPQVSPNSRAAVLRLLRDGADVASVAAEFKMKPNALYQLKNRVMRAVRRELAEYGQGRLSLVELHEALVRSSSCHCG